MAKYPQEDQHDMKLDSTTDLKDAFLAEYLLPAFESFEEALAEQCAARGTALVPSIRLANGVQLGDVQCTLHLNTTNVPPMLTLTLAHLSLRSELMHINLKPEVHGEGILNMQVVWECHTTGRTFSAAELVSYCLDRMSEASAASNPQ